MSWGAILGGLVTVAMAVIGFLKYKRGKQENLVQAEVEELKLGMDEVDKIYEKIDKGKS